MALQAALVLGPLGDVPLLGVDGPSHDEQAVHSVSLPSTAPLLLFVMRPASQKPLTHSPSAQVEQSSQTAFWPAVKMSPFMHGSEAYAPVVAPSSSPQ